MPRQPKLSWDDDRQKWRVVYRKKKYRFDGGSGKSDREAKKAAEAQWRELRHRLDGEAKANREFQEDYDRAIAEWIFLRDWSSQHGDDTLVEYANEHIAELTDRLKQRHLQPLEDCDRFLPARALSELSDEEFDDQVLLTLPHDESENLSVDERLATAKAKALRLDAVWRDRIRQKQERTSPLSTEKTLEGNIKEFLQGKHEEAKSGLLSASRLDSLTNQLAVVVSFAGPQKSVSDIDGEFLFKYRNYLLKEMSSGRYSSIYCRDLFAAFKQFVRWLVNSTNRLEHLPKNINDRNLAFPTVPKKAKILTATEIASVAEAATERTRLYILLGLNCAMTQADISDLHPSEVNWTDATITRKRSKTSNIESVPEVRYSLWPSTFMLLEKRRSKSPENVLLTVHGKPLCTTTINEDGKLKKNDAIRLAIREAAAKSGVNCTMKIFKKTSASLIRNNSDFSGIESLFLGHAPRSMSDRHYTVPPQDLLDNAIGWLAEELGVENWKSVAKS